MFPELTRDDVFRLETKRLWLRWPRAADAAALVTLAGADAAADPHLPRPCLKPDADRFILAARRDNTEGVGLKLALALRSRPQEAVGLISLTPGPVEGSLTLGFWLGLPYRGEGLMAEAIESLLTLVFGLEGFGAIEASVPRGDAVAERVLRHVGFEREEASALGEGQDVWRISRASFLAPYAAGRSLSGAPSDARNRARRRAPSLAMAEP